MKSKAFKMYLKPGMEEEYRRLRAQAADFRHVFGEEDP